METEVFWLARAVVSLVAAILLVRHMLERWDAIRGRAQRMRFTVLLGYALVQTYGLAELFHQSAPVESRHIAGTIISICLLVTVVVSTHDWRAGKDGPQR